MSGLTFWFLGRDPNRKACLAVGDAAILLLAEAVSKPCALAHSQLVLEQSR
jgi:hypothetical protein